MALLTANPFSTSVGGGQPLAQLTTQAVSTVLQAAPISPGDMCQVLWPSVVQQVRVHGCWC